MKSISSRFCRLLTAVALAVPSLTIPVIAQQGTFNKPFGPDAIWYRPIGTDAQLDSFVPGGNGQLGLVTHDVEYIVQASWSDPLRYARVPGDFGGPRAVGSFTFWEELRIPDWLTFPDASPGFTPNNGVSVVQPDGTVIELNAGARPYYGSEVWGYVWKTFPNTPAPWYGYNYQALKLDGSGYRNGAPGGHFGSGLSVLGGSIRRDGELVGGEIEHAIKVEFDANQLRTDHVWPADRSDYDLSGYNVVPGLPASQAMGMLLTFAPGTTEQSLGLTTEPGKRLFRAIYKYGAYHVDTSGYSYTRNGGYVMNICVENGVIDDFSNAGFGSFEADYGAWHGDVDKMYRAFKIVRNNVEGQATSGGGSPRGSNASSEGVSVNSIPTSVSVGSTLNTLINYTATQARYVTVTLYDGNYNWTNAASYYVGPGSGTAPISVNVPSGAATGTGHVYIALYSTDFSQTIQQIQQDIALNPAGGGGSGPNLVSNPGFEVNGGDTQTPSGWSEWSDTNSLDASFAEAGGGGIGGGSGAGTYNGSHWSPNYYRVYSYQSFSGLANGTYTLKAKMRRSGGQSAARIEAKDFGGSGILSQPAPVGYGWQDVAPLTVPVTNGQCTIGFWSDASANQWMQFDEVSFTKN